ERLIISRFRLIARASPGTVLEDLCNRLTTDDGIHHGAGMAYERVLLENASKQTKQKLVDAANRLLPIFVKHALWRPKERSGIRALDKRLPEETTEEDLLELIADLNEDDGIDGILVQTPLPSQIDEARVMRTIDPMKDVDGLHPFNAGQIFFGRQTLVGATPVGIIRLLDEYRIGLAGARAVVVGRSLIVGRPVAMLLLHANATVTICHSRTEDLARHTLDADILVAAVGQLGLVTRDIVKQGAAVIDVGMNRTDAGLFGHLEPNVAA